MRIYFNEVVLAERRFEGIGIVRASDFGEDFRQIMGRNVKGRAVMNVHGEGGIGKARGKSRK